MEIKLQQLKQTIKMAHSPDADDAFMFYGIACGSVDTTDFIIEQVYKDIETLNNEAEAGKYEVTAISFAAYPNIAHEYLLMPCGASFGQLYGPIVVAKNDISPDKLSNLTIAIPGYKTTAYLLLQLSIGPAKVIVLPFKEIIPAISKGEVDAGLIIHEGQLTYRDNGLKKIFDLAQWWHEKTGLPVPLGGNVIKRNLGQKKIDSLTNILRKSIVYALDHEENALEYALHFAGAMPTDLVRRYVRMYVNELSIDWGPLGQRAVKKLFDLSAQSKIIDWQFKDSFM